MTVPSPAHQSADPDEDLSRRSLSSGASFGAVAGLLLLADLRRRNGLWLKRWTAGVLVGTGGFELYDGTVQHKLLRLHQIRDGVDLLPMT